MFNQRYLAEKTTVVASEIIERDGEAAGVYQSSSSIVNFAHRPPLHFSKPQISASPSLSVYRPNRMHSGRASTRHEGQWADLSFLVLFLYSGLPEIGSLLSVLRKSCDRGGICDAEVPEFSAWLCFCSACFLGFGLLDLSLVLFYLCLVVFIALSLACVRVCSLLIVLGSSFFTHLVWEL